MPQHLVDPEGATDYKNELNKFWMQGREGFAYGRANNDGYNSIYQYENNMSIPILIIGSSHMLAEEVMLEENAASLLSKLSGRIAYNTGMGGHSFINCAANFDNAIKKYKPNEYAIIETHSVNFSDEELKHILNKDVFKRTAFDKGIAALIRKNPFLRLLYRQFFVSLVRDITMPKNYNSSNYSHRENTDALLSEVLGGLKRTASSYDVNLIIAYHPPVSLNKDGTLSINKSPDIEKQFSDLCAQNGIYFLNMRSRFLNEYAENHTLPYGFFNTSVGKGHMNRYGHRMFAEEIYKLIKRIEAQS